MKEPEALTTSGRLEVQNYKPHDDRYLQSAGGGQLTPAESGKDQRLMQYNINIHKDIDFKSICLCVPCFGSFLFRVLVAYDFNI